VIGSRLALVVAAAVAAPVLLQASAMMQQLGRMECMYLAYHAT
jgi:hypothetical protein